MGPTSDKVPSSQPFNPNDTKALILLWNLSLYLTSVNPNIARTLGPHKLPSHGDRSKQYITTHCIEDAHASDIYGVAVTSSYAITAAGDSSIKLWDLCTPGHPLSHQFAGAHPLGAHHVATSSSGRLAATAGFGGEINLWNLEEKTVQAKIESIEGTWALALSPSGDRLASTTCDGNISIWDTTNTGQVLNRYTTKGSFGLCIDISPDGNLIASGHQNGGIYVFNNATAKIHHSLHGLVKPIRAVKFSPGGKLLAVCGDSTLVAVFDVVSGEQVFNLSGHASWIFSVAWSPTGEYLASGSFDGKVKIWSMETRSCVATQNEATAAIYSVQWLPRGTGGGEGFVSAGANRNVNFYRETSGDA